jgi:hypothetical protein
MTRAAHIPDNEAMSYMLSTLNAGREKGQYFVSFQVMMRPFHSLTEFFFLPPTDDPSYLARLLPWQAREGDPRPRQP